MIDGASVNIVNKKRICKLSATSLVDFASVISKAIFGMGILTPETFWATAATGTIARINRTI
jgi:hypothetical protein